MVKLGTANPWSPRLGLEKGQGPKIKVKGGSPTREGKKKGERLPGDSMDPAFTGKWGIGENTR